MNAKLRVAGFIAAGALAGALATIQLQAFARNAGSPLPLQELQQLAAVFGMVKSDYVEPVDEKKLIGDAISGMVAGLDQLLARQPDPMQATRQWLEAATGRLQATARQSSPFKRLSMTRSSPMMQRPWRSC